MNVYDEVEAEEAAPPVAPPSRVAVTLADGTKGTVPSNSLGEAVQMGASTDVAPESAWDSFKSGEVAFGSNIGGGLIPGAIHSVAKSIDPEWASGWKQNYEAAVEESKAHPVARLVGGGLGSLADAFGPLGKGAGAVEGAVTKGLGAGLGARLAGQAAGASAWQYGANVGEALTEDSLGDTNNVAESVFARAANKDVLFAAGAGVALGGLGEVYKAVRGGTGILGAGKKSFSETVASDVAGTPGAGRAVEAEAAAATKAVDNLTAHGLTREQGNELYNGIGDAVNSHGHDEGALGVAMDGLEKMHARNPAVLADIKAIRAGKLASAAEQSAAFDKSIKNMMEAGNGSLEHGFAETDEIAYGLKKEQVLKNVDPSKHLQIIDSANRMSQEADAFVDHWMGEEARGGAGGELKKFTKQLADAKEKISSSATRAIMNPAEQAEASARIYLEMDGLKRSMQKIAKFGRSAYGQPAIAIDKALVPGERSWGADSISDGWRKVLEDTGTFGKIGDIQAANNANFSRGFMNRTKFQDALTVELSHVAGRPVKEMNSEAVASFLKKAASGEAGATSRQIVSDAISDQLAMISGIEQHSILDAAQSARLAKGRDALIKMGKVVDESVASSAQIRKLQERLAGEAGHGGGGLLGIVTDAVTRPATKMQSLMHAQKMVNDMKSALKESVGAVFGKASTVERPPRVMDTKALTDDVNGIKAAANNPEAMGARVERMMGKDLPAAAPNVSASVATVAARAVAFLASVAPAGQTPRGLLSQNKEVRYSDAELAQWGRTRDAVAHPEHVIAEAEKGRLSREGIQAIKHVYPTIYVQLQQMVMDRLAELDKKGLLDQMSYPRRAAIGAMLGIPADDTMTDEFRQAMQASKAEDTQQSQKGQQPKAGSKRPLKIDSKIFDPNPTRT